MGKLNDKTARFGVTADLHLNNMLPHSKPLASWRGRKGVTDRFANQLSVLEQMGKACDGTDGLIILGDLYDKRLIDAVTLRESMDVLSKMGCPVYILPGNHDAHNDRGERFMVELFTESGLNHVHVLGPTEWEAFPWLRFWCVPYGSLDNNRQTLKALAERATAPGIHILLVHQSIMGAKNGTWKCDMGLDLEVDISPRFLQVFAGHFHTHQKFSGSRGEYVGAPLQLHFGEAGNPRQFTIWTFTPRGAKPERMALDGPSFWTANALKMPPEAAPGDYVRIELEATDQEWGEGLVKVKLALEKWTREGYHVTCVHSVIPKKQSRAATPKRASFEELVTKYVDEISDSTGGFDSGLLKQIGLKALEQAKRETEER